MAALPTNFDVVVADAQKWQACLDGASHAFRRTEESLKGKTPEQQYKTLARNYQNEAERFSELLLALNPFRDYEAAVTEIKNNIRMDQHRGCAALMGR